MTGRVAIQGALVSALQASAPLTALGVNLTDFGPRSTDGAQSFPRVNVGDVILAEFDTDGTNGFDAAFRIRTHTNTGSARQCGEIQDAIYQALHKGSLTITGATLINMYRVDSDVTRTSTGAHQGVCEYRALINLS